MTNEEIKMIVKRTYFTNHYFVKTNEQLRGRGISRVNDNSYQYKITESALNKLQSQYNIKFDNHEF